MKEVFATGKHPFHFHPFDFTHFCNILAACHTHTHQN